MPLPPAPEQSVEALYQELTQLWRTIPQFDFVSEPAELIYSWLGRLYARVLQVDVGEAETAKKLTDAVTRTREAPVLITALLLRSIAMVELHLPVGIRGSFIPIGSTFDAFIAVGRALETAKSDVLIVDPYLDHKGVDEFATAVPQGLAVRLLADAHRPQSSLKPAVERWQQQYASARPLEARLSVPRALHDRLLVVDHTTVWVLTQSLKDLAARSPASIVRVDQETTALKITAYDDYWSNATAI